MKILVGIVTHNRAALLPKALDSALSQSARDIHVYVIDDCSTDDTARLRERYSQVEWKFRSKPDGYMSARNEFMTKSGFDYFVSLDDDSWFLRNDEIAVALGHFDKDPALAAIGFDIVVPQHPELRSRSAARDAGTFVGCGHMIRLAAIEKVGGYVPTPGGYGIEEQDLCLRLIDAGYKVIELPGVHVWHDKTPVARNVALQHKSEVCNDLTMAVRRAPMYLLPAMVPWKMTRQFVLSLRSGLLASYVSGLTLFFRSFPAIWRLRKPVRIETMQTYWRLLRA